MHFPFTYSSFAKGLLQISELSGKSIYWIWWSTFNKYARRV